MTREEIIKGLYRGYGCTDKDECFESGCRACLDKMFNKYEQKIRADAIDEFESAMHDLIVSCGNFVATGEVRIIAEQLKQK